MNARGLGVSLVLVIAVLTTIALLGPCHDGPSAPSSPPSVEPATAVAVPQFGRVRSKSAEGEASTDDALTDATPDSSNWIEVRFHVLQDVAAGRDTPFAGVQVRIEPTGGAARTALTDSSGNATVRAPPGGCDLVVRHPGYQPYVQKVSLPANHKDTRTVLLRRGAHLALIVVTGPERTPVPDAHVWLRYGGMGPSGTAWSNSSDISYGRTDAAGRWIYDGLAPLISARVQVQAPGFADATTDVYVHEPRRKDVTVQLEPECRLGGVVREFGGRTVSNALLRILPAGMSVWMRRHIGAREVRSDASGRFELGGLEPDSVYEISARTGGRHTPVSLVRLPAGARSVSHEIRFPPMRVVTFRLLSASGTPIRDDQIDVQLTPLSVGPDERPSQNYDVSVDVASPVTLGRYHAFVSIEDHPRAFDGELVITAQTPDVVMLRLLPQISVEGRVTDENGEPLAETEITLFSLARPDDELDVESGVDGTFRVDGASPGEWALVVSHHKFPDVRRALTLPAAFQEVRLVRSGAVRLRFPAALRDRRALTRISTPSVADPAVDDGWSEEIWQGSLARDDLHDELTPGKVRIDVEVHGFLPWRTETLVTPGGETVVNVGPLVAGIPLTGRVVDGEGRPVRNLDVNLFHADGSTTAHRTNSDGRFPTFGVRPGSHMLGVTVRGWAHQRIHVQAEREPVHVEVQLARGAWVLFQARDAAGRPAPGVDLRVEDSAERLYLEHHRTDHRGRVRFVVPPGRWQVRTANSKPVPFQTVDEQDQTVEITVR